LAVTVFAANGHGHLIIMNREVFTMTSTDLSEIPLDRHLRRLIWRELILLARAYERTRKIAERRRIAEIFDALLPMLSIVAIAGPLILTAAERAWP
jgi:hypothetical protein